MELTYNAAEDAIYYPQSIAATRPNGGENIAIINQVFERVAIAQKLSWEELAELIFWRINADSDNFPGGCSMSTIEEFLTSLKPRFEPAPRLQDDDHFIFFNFN